MGEGPAAKMFGKSYRRQYKSLIMPGPGSYEPRTLTESKFASAPNIGMGTALREDYIAKRDKDAPGPGAYEVPNHLLTGQNCPKVSMSSRRRRHDLTPLVQPGPGMYGSHSSFGY
mmetsp:Transcript_99226/g.194839  ORF Transcript_99226/g.194839 Transcript_99226/m.194839 type:complete len:115 (+) Transcript_99226:2-346(+)